MLFRPCSAICWQCSQALAAAVCAMDESPGCIVPRILFLDNYYSSEDKTNWNWPDGVKMHVVGSLILQSIFRLPCVCASNSIYLLLLFER